MLGDCSPIVGAGPWRSASLDRSPCLLSPGRLTRLAARVRRLEVDRRLARGDDPAGSALLAARAAHLACPETRHRLARALERFALTGTGSLPPFASSPLHGAIAPNRDAILELAARLRRPGLLYARGIAMLELVLIDGCGPAYVDRGGEGLARQLELAADGLLG